MTFLREIIEYFNKFLTKVTASGTVELNFLGKLVKVIIIFALTSIIKKIINKVVIRNLKKYKKHYFLMNENRATTLINILNKSISVVLTFIAILMALDVFNIPTASILATAGIGGLAIGFGAQSLVKDIITGFFILLEDQYSVGDHVEIEGKDGIVEDLGLRVTKVRDFGGELYIIPNSSIKIVTNKTRGAMRARVIVSIAYEEDVDKAIDVLTKMCEEEFDDLEIFEQKPSVMGLMSLSEYSIDIGINSMAKPLDQWEAERTIRKKALEALNRESIEIPYPKNVIYRGDEK